MRRETKYNIGMTIIACFTMGTMSILPIAIGWDYGFKGVLVGLAIDAALIGLAVLLEKAGEWTEEAHETRKDRED